MSKINNLNPYQLSSKERVIKLSYPHISRLLEFYEWTREFEADVAKETSGTEKKVLNGSSTEIEFPMVLTLTDLNNLKQWMTNRQDYQEIDDELETKIKDAIEGKKK